MNYLSSQSLRSPEGRIDRNQSLASEDKNGGDFLIAEYLVDFVLGDIFAIIILGFGDDIRLTHPDGVGMDVTFLIAQVKKLIEYICS